MSNTTAVLRGYLQSALRDSTNVTWTSGEMDNAITRAVRDLWPRVARPLDPETYTQAMTSGTYVYSISSAIVQLNRVDWVDSDGNERGTLQGTWEVLGDMLNGTGKIHVHPAIVETGGTLYYRVAFGRYDTTTNYIPDEYIELIIAQASVVLLHYLKVDRARFLQWANTRQDQNTSTNELLEMINNAEQRAREVSASKYTWRKPVPGRQ
jgi:hypothetical protein